MSEDSSDPKEEVLRGKPKTRAKRKETPIRKQRLIKEYQKDLNGKQAAIRAGFPANSAASAASRALSDPEVKALIAEDVRTKMNKLDITVERILTGLAEIAFADIGDAFNEQGQLLNIKDMPPEIRRALSSIDVYKELLDGMHIGDTVKIKLYDRYQALSLLLKYHEVAKDRVDVNVQYTLESLIAPTFDVTPKEPADV